MDTITARLEHIINRLPGPGKLIFGALVQDRQAFRALVACLVAVLGTYLQPPFLSLYSPNVQQGLRDPGSGVPIAVAAGYLLLAVLTLVGGVSGDIFGRKRFLLFGLVGVLVSNILGIFFLNSPNYPLVNALNTISTVLVIPMTVALVTVAFAKHVRPFAYGAIFGAQGVALVLASSIYGIMVNTQAEWAAFLPAIVLGVIGIRLVRRDTAESRAPRDISRRELALNVVWAAAIFALVYGLLAFGGGLSTRNMFLIVAICIGGFVIGYRWVTRRRHGDAIALYGVRNISLAILAGIVLSLSQASFFYQIGTFFQKVQGVNSVESGLRLTPYILALMAATLFIVRLSLRFGARRLITGGMFVMAIGTASLYFLQPETPYWQLILPMLLMGFGLGTALVARTVVVLTTPPPGVTGMAAGVNSAAGQSGFALGVIVSSALVTLFADLHFLEQLEAAGAPPHVIQAASDSFQDVFSRAMSGDFTRLPENIAQQVTAAFGPSFTVGLGEMYVIIAVLLAVTAVVIYFGMSKGLEGTLNKPLNQLNDPEPVQEGK